MTIQQNSKHCKISSSSVSNESLKWKRPSKRPPGKLFHTICEMILFSKPFHFMYKSTYSYIYGCRQPPCRPSSNVCQEPSTTTRGFKDTQGDTPARFTRQPRLGLRPRSTATGLWEKFTSRIRNLWPFVSDWWLCIYLSFTYAFIK